MSDELLYHVGFTGTQQGMSTRQMAALELLLQQRAPDFFHHGDCVGADAEAHAIVRRIVPFCIIIVHPPDNGAKRARCIGDSWRDPKGYLERNRDIVNECAALIAAPSSDAEELRSGTWATVLYARKMGVTVRMLGR